MINKEDKLISALDSIKFFSGFNFDLNQFKALLVVSKAGDQGVTITELSHLIGYAQGSTSRLVSKLTERVNDGKKGAGLLSLSLDLERPKYKIVKLTPKGENLISKVFATINSEAG